MYFHQQKLPKSRTEPMKYLRMRGENCMKQVGFWIPPNILCQRNNITKSVFFAVLHHRKGLNYFLMSQYVFCTVLTLNPFTPKITLAILFTVYHTVLVMLVWRIWYWINLYSLNLYFSLFSSLVCLTLYWYCKEKFCLGHSWELNC